MSQAVFGLFIEITFIATFTQRFFARCRPRARGTARAGGPPG
jgi:hypothetical protein